MTTTRTITIITELIDRIIIIIIMVIIIIVIIIIIIIICAHARGGGDLEEADVEADAEDDGACVMNDTELEKL